MRATLKRLRRFFTTGLWEEGSAHSRPRAAGFHALRVLVLSARAFRDNRCLLRATALAYTTLLSLVPLLALAFALAKGFGAQEQLRPMIDRWLAANQEGVGEKLAEFIETTSAYIQNTRVGILGGIGLVLLAWTTIKVLGTVEASFNDIWGVTRGRTLVRKFTDYISVLVVSPVPLLAAASVGAALRGSAIMRSALAWAPLAHAVEAALVLIPTWVAFTAIYIFMPNTKVRLLPALAGGMVGGTVWQAALWLYTTFQVGMSNYNAIYGTFAALPVFMIWLYLSWTIVLFGAEVAWAAQHVRHHGDEQRAAAASFAAREAVALRTMTSLAVAFQRDGAALTPEQIADRVEAPQALVRDILLGLCEAGLCAEVVRPGDNAFQPGRPLAQVAPADVLDALRTRGEPARLGEAGAEAAVVRDVLAAQASAQQAALKEPTFAEIATRALESGSTDAAPGRHPSIEGGPA